MKYRLVEFDGSVVATTDRITTRSNARLELIAEAPVDCDADEIRRAVGNDQLEPFLAGNSIAEGGYGPKLYKGALGGWEPEFVDAARVTGAARPACIAAGWDGETRIPVLVRLFREQPSFAVSPTPTLGISA